MGWAALPGCDLSQHLVMLVKPTNGNNKEVFHSQTYWTLYGIIVFFGVSTPIIKF